MFLAVFRFWGLLGPSDPLGNDRFVPKVQLTQQFNEATVTDEIAPHKAGQVRYRASWWRAQCKLNVTILEGEIVRVIGPADNNCALLLVEPLPQVDMA